MEKNLPGLDTLKSAEGWQARSNAFERIAQKESRESAARHRFHFHLEAELLRLHRELTDGSYRPGPYRAFRIHDPKERLISAAPYRDRVVHHALCNVIEPIFEQTFVSDSYANRKGKGTHQGINCYQKLSRRFPYVLKCDVRKFFPSLDHLILKKIIRRKIGCQATLQLIDRIIDNSNPQEEHFAYFPGDDLFTPHERRRGLPIGNLTSQCWANVYLNAFDHFVKVTLRAPGYLRYVDDFVLFADSKEQLWQWKRDIEAYLAGLRLMLHPHKTQVYCVADGVPFLGFQVWPYYRMVQKSKVKRFRRHLRRQVRSMQTGRLHPDRLEAMLNSWLGHIRFGQSRRLEKQVFNELHQLGVMVAIHPKGSWRVLERPRRDRSHPVPKIGIKIGA